MRRNPVPERIRVMPEPFARGVHALGAHLGAELGVVVDALRARHDLLPAHEEVVTVC